MSKNSGINSKDIFKNRLLYLERVILSNELIFLGVTKTLATDKALGIIVFLTKVV